jgi:hypothetical protein
MRRVLALLGFVLLAVSACGSGGGGSTTTSTSREAADVASPASPAEVAKLLHVDADSDNDYEAAADDTNNSALVTSAAKPASASDRRAITSLIQRYYRIAWAEDGAKGCSLLYSPLAEATPEDYGSSAGPRYMNGNTCTVVLTKMFEHLHPLLAVELPKLRVASVLLEEHHGKAILSFGAHLPERTILVVREGPRTWKLASLFDGELP